MDYKLKDHTLEELEKDKDKLIVNYVRHDYNYGATFISYTPTFSARFHLKVGLISLGLASLPALCADGLNRLGSSKFSGYFHTQTGDYLGYTSNDASEKAHSIGLQLMRENKYNDARSYFNLAYNICESGYTNEDLFKRRRDEAEKSLRKETAEREERERKEKEKEEREKSERHRMEQEQMEREAVEREKRKQLEEDAKSMYIEAHKLWNEAFTAEIENKIEEATAKFQKSLGLFRQAHILNPTTNIYAKWVEICTLKLEGNIYFNEGVTLHEEANGLRKARKYRDALDKYNKAKNKYQEALDKSNDARFKACIFVIDECISETKDEIQNIEIEEQTRRVRISDTIAGENDEARNYEPSFEGNNPKITHHRVLEA